MRQAQRRCVIADMLPDRIGRDLQRPGPHLMLSLTMPDHPAVWMSVSATGPWHRQRDPDFARGSGDARPEHRAACGEELPGPLTRADAPRGAVCPRCAEISDYEASFPPT